MELDEHDGLQTREQMLAGLSALPSSPVSDLVIKPADLMRAIEYALRRSPVTETVFSEEGDFDTEITEPASLEAFATALISEVVPHIMAAALSSAAVAEREPVLWADPQDIADTSKSKHGSYTLPLYLDPPHLSELEAEIARLRAERDDLKDEWQAEFESRVEANTALRMTKARLAEAMKAIDALVDLNDNHSPFGGELYQDRIDRTWEAARRVREGGKADG